MKILSLYFMALMFLCSFAIHSVAQTSETTSSHVTSPVLHLEPGKDSAESIGRYFQYYEDVEGISIEELLSKDFNFQPITTPKINFGFSTSTFWLKVNLRNDGAKAASWKLATYARKRKLFAVYDIKEDRALELVNSVTDSIFDDRLIRHHHLFTEVQLAPGEQKQLIIQMQSDFTTILPLNFLSPDSYSLLLKQQYFSLGLFLAIMSLLALINLFQFIAVRKPVYAYYALMVFSSALLVTHHDGLNFQYLWPNSPNFDLQMTTILSVLTSTLVLQVYRYAIDLRSLSSRLDLAIATFISIWLFTPLLLIIFEFQVITMILGALAVPLSVFFLSMVVYVCLKYKAPLAYLYVPGWMCYVASSAILHLSHLGVSYPFSMDPLYIYEAGMVAEAIILSLVLAQRVRVLHHEKNMAHRERIDLLEDRLADIETISQLDKEKQLAVQVSNEKTLQLASTSHDVYQPLYAMRAALATIRDELPDGEALDEVDSAINYAQAILKDNINQSRSELASSPSLIALGNVFNELFTHNFRAAQDKGIKLKFAPTILYIHGSNTVLLRILDNLIKNAVRYTDEGTVLYGVRRRENSVDIQIIDTGPGIEAAEVERIQSPYERGKNLNESQAGFGLGLSIINTLCEQQHYKLSVTSELGKGSVFSVSIPIT